MLVRGVYEVGVVVEEALSSKEGDRVEDGEMPMDVLGGHRGRRVWCDRSGGVTIEAFDADGEGSDDEQCW